MKAPHDPLASVSPPEVQLPNAPLVRVLAQVRFPATLSVADRKFVAPFQEPLRTRYPVIRQERIHELRIGPDGIQTTAAADLGRVAWRFSDTEGKWQVTLADDFVSIETTDYASRDDFFARLGDVVESLGASIEPPFIERVGVRYVNRIDGPMVDELDVLLIPEVRGILGTSAAAHVRHSIVETLFEHDDYRILSRWGQVPPGVTVDPSAIEPIDRPSWLLDLDLHTASRMPFSVDGVTAKAESFAERAYTLFRWAVTDEFLRRHGGEI